MTPDELVKCAGLISSYWPNCPANNALLFAAERQWGDLEAEAVIAAIDTLAADGEKFAPPVGLIGRRAREACGPRIPDVDEAWGEVMGRARGSGFRLGSSVGFSHPAIDNAVCALSWWRICYDENQTALFAQFRQTYQSGRERAARDQIMPPVAREALAGLAAQLEAKRRELGA